MQLLIVETVNNQAAKSLTKHPDWVKQLFGYALNCLSAGKLPEQGVEVEPLDEVGKKVYEIKINGHPAFRLVYAIKGPHLVILHSFKKTANGRDPKNMETCKSRYKLL